MELSFYSAHPQQDFADLGELGGRVADAAGAAVDEYRLAGPETARSIRLVQAVQRFSGSAAACARLSPRGIGRQWLASVMQYSAQAPLGVSAQALSPMFHCVLSNSEFGVRI